MDLKSRKRKKKTTLICLFDMEVYKIIYIDERNKYGLFMFTARSREEANETYNRLRFEHDCYLPKITRIFWKGTLNEWTNEQNKLRNGYYKRDTTIKDKHDSDLQQDVNEVEN